MPMQKSTRFILTRFLFLLSVEFAYAEVCKGNKVPRDALMEDDAQAVLALDEHGAQSTRDA